MSSKIGVLKYQICFVSSEDDDCLAENLLEFNKDSIGWSTKKYAPLPQMLIIRFDGEVELSKITILSHENRIAKRIEIYRGNLITPFSELTVSNSESHINYRKVKFERVGYCSLNSNRETNYLAREVKTAKLSITTSFLKFVFSKIHQNKFNYHNQIGIIGVSCIGRVINAFPRYKNDNIQLRNVQKKKKIMVQNKFENRVTDDYDKETNEILRELTFYKEKAIKEENFILCEKLKLKINKINDNYNKIVSLEREKTNAINNEDFLTADKIKKILIKLRNPPSPRKLSKHKKRMIEPKSPFIDTGDMENVTKQLEIEREEEESLDDHDSDEEDTSVPVKIVKPKRTKKVSHRNRNKVFHPKNARAKVLLKDSLGDNEELDHSQDRSREMDEEEGEHMDNSNLEESDIIDDEEESFHNEESKNKKNGRKNSKRMLKVDDIKLKPPKRKVTRKRNDNIRHDEKAIRGVKNPDTFYSEAKEEDVEEDMQMRMRGSYHYDDEEGEGEAEERDQNYYEELFSGLKEWQVLLIKKIISEVKKRPDIRTKNPEPDRKISNNIDTSICEPFFGIYITKCLFSSKQRHFREITTKLIMEHIEEIKEGKIPLFNAMFSYLKEGLTDRIFQVFFLNMDLLRKVMQFAIGSMKKSIVHHRVSPIIKIFIRNFGDNNRKKRKESKDILLEFCSESKIGPAMVINNLFKKRKKEKKQSHWKQDYDRLDIVCKIINTYGLNQNTGLTVSRVMNFIFPILSHSRSEVRKKSFDIVHEAYKVFESALSEQRNVQGVPQKIFESKYLFDIEDGPLKKSLLKKLGFEEVKKSKRVIEFSNLAPSKPTKNSKGKKDHGRKGDKKAEKKASKKERKKSRRVISNDQLQSKNVPLKKSKRVISDLGVQKVKKVKEE